MLSTLLPGTLLSRPTQLQHWLKSCLKSKFTIRSQTIIILAKDNISILVSYKWQFKCLHYSPGKQNICQMCVQILSCCSLDLKPSELETLAWIGFQRMFINHFTRPLCIVTNWCLPIGSLTDSHWPVWCTVS